VAQDELEISVIVKSLSYFPPQAADYILSNGEWLALVGDYRATKLEQNKFRHSPLRYQDTRQKNNWERHIPADNAPD
jgi:hypothetical protein